MKVSWKRSKEFANFIVTYLFLLRNRLSLPTKTKNRRRGKTQLKQMAWHMEVHKPGLQTNWRDSCRVPLCRGTHCNPITWHVYKALPDAILSQSAWRERQFLLPFQFASSMWICYNAVKGRMEILFIFKQSVLRAD